MGKKSNAQCENVTLNEANESPMTATCWQRNRQVRHLHTALTYFTLQRKRIKNRETRVKQSFQSPFRQEAKPNAFLKIA